MKAFSALVAALMVLAVAGQASASYVDLNLFRTIYDTSATTEKGSDLGLQALTTSGAYGMNVFVGDNIAKSSFSGDLGSLNVAYYASNRNGTPSNLNDDGYWATGDFTGFSLKGSKGAVLNTDATGVQGYYGTTLGGGSTVTGSTTNQKSFYYLYEKNGIGIGSYGSTTGSTSSLTTVSLADLLTTGFVDQKLYYIPYNNATGTVNGVQVATIRTFLTTDGTTIDLAGTKIATEINPVPIPAAAWLLGTGIVGMVGIRRRQR